MRSLGPVRVLSRSRRLSRLGPRHPAVTAAASRYLPDPAAGHEVEHVDAELAALAAHPAEDVDVASTASARARRGRARLRVRTAVREGRICARSHFS